MFKIIFFILIVILGNYAGIQLAWYGELAVFLVGTTIANAFDSDFIGQVAIVFLVGMLFGDYHTRNNTIIDDSSGIAWLFEKPFENIKN